MVGPVGVGTIEDEELTPVALVAPVAVPDVLEGVPTDKEDDTDERVEAEEVATVELKA
jgi:hypothetical protein